MSRAQASDSNRRAVSDSGVKRIRIVAAPTTLKRSHPSDTPIKVVRPIQHLAMPELQAARTSKPQPLMTASTRIEVRSSEGKRRRVQAEQPPIRVAFPKRTLSDSFTVRQSPVPTVATARTSMPAARAFDDYFDETMDYWLSIERRTLPGAAYMAQQAELNWAMRERLVDWLIQVADYATLSLPCLYMAVSLTDRVLASTPVAKVKLQLIGCVALYIAAKYSETRIPTLKQMLDIMDGVYPLDEFKWAEREVLKLLQYDLAYPSAGDFLGRLTSLNDGDADIEALTEYCLLATALDERFVSCPPSLGAASALYIALKALQREQWTAEHFQATRYHTWQFVEIAQAMADSVRRVSSRSPFLFRKYSSADRRHVALFLGRWLESQPNGNTS
ncbi:B-type cyclin [Sorochytrium milnesiophthora]